MKKIYLLFLLAFLPLLANADAVEIDGIYYNLNEENHTAEVTTNPNHYSGEVTIPASITYNATVYSVTTIGKYALADGGLKKVNIPSTVTTIGFGAFYFSSLEEITLPEGLTAIEDFVFWGCSSLKKVIIPSTVTRIGNNPGEEADGPFSGCPLETLIVPPSVQTIGRCGLWATPNTIIIMESATPPSSIDNNALEDALGTHVFSKIIVPDGSKNAYQNANVWKKYSDDILEMSESSVSLPLQDNADAVEINGIYYNLNAENHTAEVTTNPNHYSGEVTIPATVTYQTEDYSVTSIGVFAFGGDNIRSVTIPSSVNTIGECAFTFCSSLEEVNLPEGLTAIEGDVFFECSSLTKVIIPSSVTRIGKVYENPGDEADAPFGGCPLTTLIVPASVQTIGQYGLWGTPNTIIIMESATPPSSIDDLAFEDGVGTLVFSKIIVPDGSKNAYQNANVWKKYKNMIFEMSESSVRVFKGVTAGTLPTLISEGEKYDIEHLEISGSLNGTDIRLLRDMAGNNYLGQQTNGILKYLDISDVNIVAGGERYLDTTEGVIVNKNGDVVQGTHQFGTQNNVIGNSMFLSCQKLEEILLPHSITTIVAKSFGFCRELKSFVLPENVSSIEGGGGILYATDKLEKLKVASGNQTFSSPAKSNAIMQGTKLIRGCNGTIIPPETTIIGECAFMASAISSITLPKNVTSIEADAFNSCWNLATLLVEVATPIVIDNTVFTEYNATLIVPEGCKADYEAANYWKNFTTEEFSLPKAKAGLEYTGAAQDLITAGSFATMKYSLDADYSYSRDIPQGKNAQEYIVYYKDETNHLGGSINVTIAPKEVSNPRIVLFSTAFSLNEDDNHDPIEPEVLYVFDGDVSIPETEYTVCYSNNTNVGTATVTITDKAGGNYNVSGSTTFTIGRAIKFGESYKLKDYVAKEDLEVPSGLTAYIITSIETSSAIASEIDYIPQGVPVLLKRDDSFKYSFFASPGTGTPPTTNLLKSYTTDKIVANREGYVLYKDEFVLVSAGTLPAGKVFLPADNPGSASTRSIVFEGEGTTSLNKVNSEEAKSEQWYDVQGRKLSEKPIKKGVYILNGRKVVVK